MEPEPNYIYVPGQGWVVQTTTTIYTFQCGTKARLEIRIPRKGEKYRYASGSSGEGWGIERWVRFFKESTVNFAFTAIADCDDPMADYRKNKAHFAYCVLTVID